MAYRKIPISDVSAEVREALQMDRVKFDELKAFALTVHQAILRDQPRSTWADPYTTWSTLPIHEKLAALDTLRQLCRLYRVFGYDHPEVDREGGMENRLAETRRLWCATRRHQIRATLVADSDDERISAKAKGKRRARTRTETQTQIQTQPPPQLHNETQAQAEPLSLTMPPMPTYTQYRYPLSIPAMMRPLTNAIAGMTTGTISVDISSRPILTPPNTTPFTATNNNSNNNNNNNNNNTSNNNSNNTATTTTTTTPNTTTNSDTTSTRRQFFDPVRDI